jgi:hypothetical protein
VPLASHSVRKETVLPEDDPEGLKHVGGFYSEDNTHIVHLLVIITFIGKKCQQPTCTHNSVTTDIQVFIYPDMFQRITASY